MYTQNIYVDSIKNSHMFSNNKLNMFYMYKWSFYLAFFSECDRMTETLENLKAINFLYS